MKLSTIGIIILVIISTINCENFFERLNASNSFFFDPNQEACNLLVRSDFYDCYLEYCSTINCFDNSKQVYCTGLWYSICCVEYRMINKCSVNDCQLIKNNFEIWQMNEESVNCAQYPRSSVKCETLYMNGTHSASFSVSIYSVFSKNLGLIPVKLIFLKFIAVVYFIHKII
jgi:hypothetical protein